MNKYLTYNHSFDFFDNIGDELYKLAVVLTSSLKYNKILIFNNENFVKIFETQIQIPFKLINDIKEYDKFNPSILNIDLDYNEKIISEEALIYLNNIILKNKDFTNENYKKINEIMNYFHDYEINNYICIIINKKTYNPYIYEETLNNYKDKKDNTKLPKEYIENRTRELCDKYLDWCEYMLLVETDNDVMGCVSQRRMSLKNNPGNAT